MFIWNVDGVKISDVCAFDPANQSVVGTATLGDRCYKWWATVGPNGWTIVFEDFRNLKQTYCGNTFNLFLEVAAAIRRLG